MLTQTQKDRLQHWQQQALTRQLNCRDDQAYIDFSSNDYLGLKQHPVIKQAFIDGVDHYGLGSGAASLVSGYTQAQQDLEQQFADWLGFEKALYFNSGYLANIGVITSLADRHSRIIMDKLCHASLLDGVLLSRAKYWRYKHLDLGNLQYLTHSHQPDCLISESVFSMEGDIAPVNQLLKIASDHQAQSIIDDAHGIGVLGEHGRGIIEYEKIDIKQLTCLVLPLGKAFNGIGAMVAGSKEVINYILQFARSYRYTTAMSPAVCKGLQASLALVAGAQKERGCLKELISYFHELIKKHNLELINYNNTPIKTIRIDNKTIITLQQTLLKHGFLTAAIRYPTVPKDKSRLRISLTAQHTPEQIEQLIKLINQNR